MNGGADLGGVMGFGPVVEEADEPNFHAEWEARVLGMVVALGACGQWTLDQSRFARENRPPPAYMMMSYYEIWLEAAITLMTERGMITATELEQGRALQAPIAIRRRLVAADVEAVLNAGGPVNRPEIGEPAFAPGDRIRTINLHPEGHTRLPRYARDKTGTVTKVHGFHVYPDDSVSGQERAEWLYQITFDARTLWGPKQSPRDIVTLDLWQPYLIANP
ncbi:nitrile hydratase subunit beta [Pontivivens insulae]|uniref:Nitrile hydratase subunit beta n=1 Tax=Pontivivens insulae TaxID=1639689 RepID=A0A2R8ACY1_9RHOB|nr:nitrile hydratase subunit beta [Pontivivens insulae]RED14030.1 nitrile hydratase [Pontivivens insulae]SPF30104.1 Nitrile hydratase subunit beta [Pontivivens insulae]